MAVNFSNKNTRDSISISVKRLLVSTTKVCLLLSMAFPSFGNAIEVAEKAMELIKESITLELIHNPALKDPHDTLPLELIFSKLEVVQFSIFEEPTSVETLLIYTIKVPYKTVEGETGNLLCKTTLVVDSNGQKSKGAKCEIENSMGHATEDNEGVLIDE